ncbi:hypothetical protein CPB84DRAFT_1878069, partial [Gymnopilus junonius]
KEATKRSTETWQNNLELVFHHAKNQFTDVIWEFVSEKEDDVKVLEHVWGHKAIAYARAPPSFQNWYFASRPNGATSPLPSASSLGPETSMTAFARTPPPNLHSSSSSNTLPAPTFSSVIPTTSSTLLRLTTSMNPTIFSAELEFLYTGKGF